MYYYFINISFNQTFGKFNFLRVWIIVQSLYPGGTVGAHKLQKHVTISEQIHQLTLSCIACLLFSSLILNLLHNTTREKESSTLLLSSTNHNTYGIHDDAHYKLNSVPWVVTNGMVWYTWKFNRSFTKKACSKRKWTNVWKWWHSNIIHLGPSLIWPQPFALCSSISIR